MKKSLILIALGLFSAGASAATYEVSITGPGGHSNGNYGNTNAVHAGSRAVLQIEKLLPCASMSSFKGGATVNAIAADATFLVNIDGCGANALETLTQAVKVGVDLENNFRGVKPGDMVRGFPADIKFSIKELK